MRLRPACSAPSTLLAMMATLMASALLLSACSTGDGLQRWPDAVDPEIPLPAGSTFSTDGETGPVQDDGGVPFGSLAPDDADSAERVPAIIERGRINVGVAQSMNQLGFRDPVTGDMAGFEVDLAHEIARDIFGDPDRVDFRYVEDSDRVQALLDGDVDMVIRSMTITRPRQTTVEYSAPYLSVNPRLLVSRNSGITSEDDLAEKTVCATRSSTSAQSLTSDIAHGKLLFTQTWPDCLMAMQHGQVDAIYSDSAVLSGLRAQDPNTELIGDSDETEVYGVATAPPTLRDTTGLVRQINSTLERIRADGTWDRIYERWLGPYMGPGTQPAAEYRSDAESAQLRSIRRAAEAASSAAATTSETAGTEAGAGEKDASPATASPPSPEPVPDTTSTEGS